MNPRWSDSLARVLSATATTRPSRGVTRLERESIVPVPLSETFAFFSDAANLERLTPPWLNFAIRTPQPIAMREGVEIDYQIVLHGVPLPWRSRIDVWEHERRFVDRQLIGPYRWWHHEHRFEAAGSATRVIDVVEYVPRARWLSEPFVAREVVKIFDYRSRVLGSVWSDAAAGAV